MVHSRPDAVIVGEPSSPDVWIAELGLEHVRIEKDGLATHRLNRRRALPPGDRSDAGGVNAIAKARMAHHIVHHGSPRIATVALALVRIGFKFDEGFPDGFQSVS